MSIQQTSHKARIAVIGTGGTISSIGRHPLDLIEYTEAGIRKDTEGLLELFPFVHEVADVVPLPFKLVSSAQIGPPEWLELAAMINQRGRTEPDLDGFVVTHGTATTEETAYFLNLCLHVPQPVVIVGAQRPSSGLSTDAEINLVNAIRTAAAPQSRGMGVLVMLNDEIQAAREVTKTSTLRMHTFRTPDFGVLGQVDADAVTFYRRTLRRNAPDTEFFLDGLDSLPRVDISYAYGGADDAAVRAFMAAGCAGIVSAGFAPGIGTKAETDALQEACAQGIVVVQSSRAGSGRVTQRSSLTSRGIIAADNLNPQKARILLMLALTKTDDRDEIARMFSEY